MTPTPLFCRSKPALAAAALALCCLPSFITAGPSKPARPDLSPADDDRIGWWREVKFGMFIHWGLYAVPAGEWNGQRVPGIGEWIMNKARIPAADYAKFANDLNPVNFDADSWASLAKEAGMKYLIITAKHHDGFAMFDTKVSDFDIVDATPFKRDPLKDLAEACRKHGIKLGFYYSQSQDWHHPGGAGNSWDPSVEGDYDTYLDRVAVPQVRELLTHYGPVAVLWYDTPRRMTRERAEKFLPLHQLQPGLIFNNRLATPDPEGKIMLGDTETPEQFIPPNGYPGHDWETCMTMNDTWGFKKNDHNWKSSATLIRNLSDIASKGGNFLLNIGPDATGTIPAPSVERLREIGAWLKMNGEAVYGTHGGPFPRRLDWGRATIRKRPYGSTTLYTHIWQRPADGRILLPGVTQRPTAARMLVGGAKVSIHSDNAGVWLDLPEFSNDSPVTVAVVEFPAEITTSQRITGPGPDGTIELGALEAALSGPDGAKPLLSGVGEDTSFKTSIGWKAQYSFETPADQLWQVTTEVSLAAYNRLNFSAPGPFGRSIATAIQPYGKGPGEFGTVEIGVIRLPAGINSLELKSEMEDTRPIEIRRIQLRPLK
jgi:alpha-L-fucosidase